MKLGWDKDSRIFSCRWFSRLSCKNCHRGVIKRCSPGWSDESWASWWTTVALAVLTDEVLPSSETRNPDLMTSPCLAFLRQQHCVPFCLPTLFKLPINTSISIYSINISATQLPSAALLWGHAKNVGSTWQVNDNYYITLLKFRLIGIWDQFCLISRPPAGAQMSVFHSKAQTACSTVTLYFVSGPRLLGNSSHGSPQSIPT